MQVVTRQGKGRARLTQTALFLMPFTALHLGFNLPLGDVVFAAAVLLGLGGCPGLGRAEAWLAAAVGVLVAGSSGLTYLLGDARGGIIDGVQATFLFVAVIPFGWCALRGLTLEAILRPLFAAAVVNAAAVYVQIAWPSAQLPTQSQYGMAEFGLRPLGLTGNPNGLGLLMTWAIPLGIHLAACSTRRRNAFGWTFLTVAVAVAGMLSFSKAAMVGIPVALMVSQVLLGRRPGILAGLLFLAMAAVAFVFGPQLTWVAEAVHYRLFSPDSFDSRAGGMVAAWAAVREWFWLGAGPGQDARYGDGVAQIHNQVLGFFVQFGIVAALVFWALKVLVAVRALRLLADRRFRVIAVAFILTEVALLVHPVYWIRAHYLPLILVLWATGVGVPGSVGSEHEGGVSA